MGRNRLIRAKRKLYKSSLKTLDKNLNQFVIIKELDARENGEITFEV